MQDVAFTQGRRHEMVSKGAQVLFVCHLKIKRNKISLLSKKCGGGGGGLAPPLLHGETLNVYGKTLCVSSNRLSGLYQISSHLKAY